MSNGAPDILLVGNSSTTAELFVLAFRLDGFEVLERLRADARSRHLPVLVYSACDRHSDRSEALRRGASGYVYKPVGFKNACAAIAQLKRDWLEREWPDGREGTAGEHAS